MDNISINNDFRAIKEKELQAEINKAIKNKEHNKMYANLPMINEKYNGFKKLFDHGKNKELIKKCYTSVKNIDSLDRGLYLYGDVGTGKTTLLALMAKYVHEVKNKRFYYASEEDLLTQIRQAFNEKRPDTDVIKEIASKDIIFIDEVGQNKKEYSIRTLKRLFDEIINKRKKLFITSNYDFEELNEQWHTEVKDKTPEQTIDRLRELTEFIKINGSSLRKNG